METGLRDISDIFEVNIIRGLSQDTINELPSFEFNNAATPCSDTSCAICLQVALCSILFDLLKPKLESFLIPNLLCPIN